MSFQREWRHCLEENSELFFFFFKIPSLPPLSSNTMGKASAFSHTLSSAHRGKSRNSRGCGLWWCLGSGSPSVTLSIGCMVRTPEHMEWRVFSDRVIFSGYLLWVSECNVDIWGEMWASHFSMVSLQPLPRAGWWWLALRTDSLRANALPINDRIILPSRQRSNYKQFYNWFIWALKTLQIIKSTGIKQHYLY